MNTKKNTTETKVQSKRANKERKKWKERAKKLGDKKRYLRIQFTEINFSSLVHMVNGQTHQLSLTKNCIFSTDFIEQKMNCF